MARILVIEDDVASLELIRYLLEAFGHTALIARDGEKGLEIAQREVLDLILCDIRLPKIDGYEVACRLKGHPVLGAIPLVAVTAYAMVGDSEKMLKAGFDGYLPKPIVPEMFVKQVESFLRPDPPLDSVQSLQEVADGDIPSLLPFARRTGVLRRNGSLAKAVCDFVREFILARSVQTCAPLALRTSRFAFR